MELLLCFWTWYLKSIQNWWTRRSKCMHHSVSCCSYITCPESIWPKLLRQHCLSKECTSKHFFSLCILYVVKNVFVRTVSHANFSGGPRQEKIEQCCKKKHSPWVPSPWQGTRHVVSIQCGKPVRMALHDFTAWILTTVNVVFQTRGRIKSFMANLEN